MNQITVKNLTLGYDGKAVVNGLSFEANKGDYICVVGENGSGKSTLVKALLGMVAPLGGEIVFADKIKQGIGYLPQQTMLQRDFPASVEEVVLSGLASRRRFFYSKALKQKAYQDMKRLGVDKFADKCYRELSGGQQQKVLLARALCATKELLLLDEPVTGLDPKATAEMYEIISELNRLGLTVIMVSHDINAAVKYAGKILHLSHDAVYFGNTADYVLSDIGAEYLKGGKNDGIF